MPEWKVINQSGDSLLFHRSQPPPALPQYPKHCLDPMQLTERILMKGAPCPLRPPPIESVLMLIMNPSSRPSPALCLLANRTHYYCWGRKLYYVEMHEKNKLQGQSLEGYGPVSAKMAVSKFHSSSPLTDCPGQGGSLTSVQELLILLSPGFKDCWMSLSVLYRTTGISRICLW